MEEAFKMRNLLQEFLKKHGVRKPTILGLREHIFTGRYGCLRTLGRDFFFFFFGKTDILSFLNLSFSFS